MTVLDDLEEFAAPPLHGKTHPPAAMDEAVPTLDDADRMFRHHPNDQVSEGFSFDPDVGDAAADLAGDMGAEFLEGATRGRDISDMMMSEEEHMEETPYLVEEVGPEGEDAYFSEEDRIEMESERGGEFGQPASRTRARSTQ